MDYILNGTPIAQTVALLEHLLENYRKKNFLHLLRSNTNYIGIVVVGHIDTCNLIFPDSVFSIRNDDCER